MAGREMTVLLPGRLAGDDWIKVNAGQTGFYRVNYAEGEWARLRHAVERLELPTTDRLGLQNDAYALVRAGLAPATVFLSLAQSYINEEDASVWGDLSINLRGLETLLFDEAFFAQFQAFARRIFDQVVRRVAWDAQPGEGHLDALRRSTVLAQSGAYGNPDVLREAQNRFAHYLERPAALHPDLRGVVFGLAAQQGDRTTYDQLWELYRQATLQEEKNRFLGALSRFQQRDLLQETLDRGLSSDVRSQDTVSVVGAVAGNRHGRDLAWDFVKTNWDEFDRRYGRGGFAIMNLVSITGGFTKIERAQEVEEFFQSHPAPSAARTIQQSLERIRLSVKWLEQNRQGLQDWFAAQR